MRKATISIAAALLAAQMGHGPALSADLLPVSVELGDVSLTKLPFIVAAESGIYERNGLKVHQFISPRAAELIQQSSGPRRAEGDGPSRTQRHQYRRRQPDHGAHDLGRARPAARDPRHE